MRLFAQPHRLTCQVLDKFILHKVCPVTENVVFELFMVYPVSGVNVAPKFDEVEEKDLVRVYPETP